MKVGINALLLGGGHSGVEMSITSLVQAMAGYGRHDYVVYAPSCSEWRVNTDRVTTQVIDMQAYSRTKRIWIEHTRLDKLAKADGCDAFHGPGYILPRGLRCRQVATVHDLFALSQPAWCTRSNRYYFGWGLPRTIRCADVIHVPSQYVADEIRRYFPQAVTKVKVQPFAVRTSIIKTGRDEDREALAKRYTMPASYFLFVGNREPKKNIPGMLAGYARYRETSSSPQDLLMVGGKSWGPTWETDVDRLGLREHVHLLDYVSDSELSALYQGATGLVFVSLAEGFGFPAIEAMANGAPVIVSTAGSLPGVAGDAALAVDPGDADGLAGALQSLASDESIRSEWVERGYARVDHFSWESFASAMDDMYEGNTV